MVYKKGESSEGKKLSLLAQMVQRIWDYKFHNNTHFFLEEYYVSCGDLPHDRGLNLCLSLFNNYFPYHIGCPVLPV
jgi:hypothetical protein